MAFSQLLLRNFSPRNTKFRFRILSLLTENIQSTNGGNFKRFAAFHTETDGPKPPVPKPTLSARLSFVFDQIDEIEKDRSNKDEALQRIRAWRETKKKSNEDETSEIGVSGDSKKKDSLFKKEVEVVHPWPEWVELMERLVQQNYFDHRRTDEEKIVEDLSIDVSSFPEENFDFSRDWNAVRTACLNFGRDRFDILRSLSRKDIQILVGHGCPSTDRRVVFSGKMLRKHVHIDEGDVCSSCNLRGSCEKAYLLSRKEDEARTIDVMRILLSYGFDPVNGSVENKSLLKMKSVKTVVRKLLHEVVKLSAVPIDPNLPPPVIKKPPPKVKQPPPPPRRRVGRDDVEMKKGDWLCTKCDFMNFAKNTVCLQCDAKRPKRQLLPGEWECPECNFLNYRRNMACFHCEHKRPPDEFMENQSQERQHGPRTRLERVPDMPAGSNSWNFDFDDNESDGADVAAFEYADPPRMAEDSPIESHVQSGNSRGYEDDSFESGRMPRSSERGRYPDLDQRKSATGFDDFDDEEDDDVNSYELETPNNTTREPSRDFSEVELEGYSDDFDGPDHHAHAQRGGRSSSSNMHSRSLRRGTFSGSEDDVEGLDSYGTTSGYSHNVDSRNGIRGGGRSGAHRGRGLSGSNRGRGFASDSELDVDSGSDGDMDRGVRSNQNTRNKWSPNKKGFGRGGSSDSEDGLAFGSESDDDDLGSRKNKFGGTRPVRREKTFRSSGQFESSREDGFRSNVRKNNSRNSFDNADREKSFRSSRQNSRESSGDGYRQKRGSYGNSSSGRSSQDSFRSSRGSNVDGYGGRRANDKGFAKNSDRDRRGEGGGYRKNGRSNGFNDRSETARNYEDDDRPRRVIERTQPVKDWN